MTYGEPTLAKQQPFLRRAAQSLNQRLGLFPCGAHSPLHVVRRGSAFRLGRSAKSLKDGWVSQQGYPATYRTTRTDLMTTGGSGILMRSPPSFVVDDCEILSATSSPSITS